MVINIGCLYDTRTHSLFLCYTQFAQEEADREARNKQRLVN
jgi:hypothetical protein